MQFSSLYITLRLTQSKIGGDERSVKSLTGASELSVIRFVFAAVWQKSDMLKLPPPAQLDVPLSRGSEHAKDDGTMRRAVETT